MKKVNNERIKELSNELHEALAQDKDHAALILASAGESEVGSVCGKGGEVIGLLVKAMIRNEDLVPLFEETMRIYKQMEREGKVHVVRGLFKMMEGIKMVNADEMTDKDLEAMKKDAKEKGIGVIDMTDKAKRKRSDDDIERINYNVKTAGDC